MNKTKFKSEPEPNGWLEIRMLQRRVPFVEKISQIGTPNVEVDEHCQQNGEKMYNQRDCRKYFLLTELN